MLKTMLWKFCNETKHEWGEGLLLLLFAARETVQESLEFSPDYVTLSSNMTWGKTIDMKLDAWTLWICLGMPNIVKKFTRILMMARDFRLHSGMASG